MPLRSKQDRHYLQPQANYVSSVHIHPSLQGINIYQASTELNDGYDTAHPVLEVPLQKPKDAYHQWTRGHELLITFRVGWRFLMQIDSVIFISAQSRPALSISMLKPEFISIFDAFRWVSAM